MASRTMLAASFDDEDLLDLKAALTRYVTFPVLASPKIDGIRFTGVECQAQSRSGKALPNLFFQKQFSEGLLNHFDGEVVVGLDPACTNTTNGTLCNRTQSAIMTQSGSPEHSLHVFDYIRNPSDPFNYRTERAHSKIMDLNASGLLPGVKLNYVKHFLLMNPQEVIAFEEESLLAGYEGIMLRSPHATYKFGRSTLKQQGLIKIKRFKDDEATIVGFEALERNTNPIVRDSFGLAKRSSHKAGKVPDNLLGKLKVRHATYGDFAIGSGFDVDTRIEIWFNQTKYLGKLVTYKYQPHGTMDAPRVPIFKGIRHADDT